MELGQWLEVLSQKVIGQCSYFEGKKTRESFLSLENPNELVVKSLIERGYRRFGHVFYRSDCPHCLQCMSYRVPVTSFKLSPNMKRVLKRNRDLVVCWQAPRFTLAKVRLYLKYQREQHPENPYHKGYRLKDYSLVKQKLTNMKIQMFSPLPTTVELTLYLNNRLVGFAIFDQVKDVLSAVYSVYDPSLRQRSLGTAIILYGMNYALEKKIPYLYLGYYIPQSPKMNYKRRFKPAEIRDPLTGQWLEAGKAVELIDSLLNSNKI